METVTRTHVTPGVHSCDSFKVEQMKDTVFLYLHQCPLALAAEELNPECSGRGEVGGRNVLSGSQSQHPRAENKRLGLGPRASALMLSARRWRKGFKPVVGAAPSGWEWGPVPLCTRIPPVKLDP